MQKESPENAFHPGWFSIAAELNDSSNCNPKGAQAMKNWTGKPVNHSEMVAKISITFDN